MLFRRFPLLALLALPLCQVRAAEPVSLDEFARVSSLVKPHEGDRAWSSIPWRTGLWEARREAAALGKPILLWEMDGHPLGCT